MIPRGPEPKIMLRKPPPPDSSVTAGSSVPPSTANYVQRVGRAGRKTGNSLVLALANGLVAAGALLLARWERPPALERPAQALGGRGGQGFDDFDGVHLRNQFGQHRRLIAGAGTDLEHTLQRAAFEQRRRHTRRPNSMR